MMLPLMGRAQALQRGRNLSSWHGSQKRASFSLKKDPCSTLRQLAHAKHSGCQLRPVRYSLPVRYIFLNSQIFVTYCFARSTPGASSGLSDLPFYFYYHYSHSHSHSYKYYSYYYYYYEIITPLLLLLLLPVLLVFPPSCLVAHMT